MGSTNSILSVKQEIRYIKIPDRRLISGLLYINVVNNESNDTEDDFMQQCFDHTPSEGILDSTSFNTDGDSTQERVEQGREGMKHSFADYDCFLFYVCGGMSLTGGLANPVGVTPISGGAALTTAGYTTYNSLEGTWSWEDTSAVLNTKDLNADWYPNALHGDYCQHFIRSHLISRMNNASGHDQDDVAGNRAYFKHRPAQRTKWAQPGNKDTNDSDGAVITDEWILSEGTYNIRDSKEIALTKSSIVGLETGNSNNSDYAQMTTKESVGGDASPAAPGHTYYAPVDKVKIYGKHKLVEDIHNDNDTSNYVSSMEGSRAVHITTFWDLVIDIGIRGNNSDDTTVANGNFTTDKQIMDTQVNVAFHPFGETADFDISETEHTS